MGKFGRQGSIEPGAKPLVDFANTKRISAVVLRGKRFAVTGEWFSAMTSHQSQVLFFCGIHGSCRRRAKPCSPPRSSVQQEHEDPAQAEAWPTSAVTAIRGRHTCRSQGRPKKVGSSARCR